MTSPNGASGDPGPAHLLLTVLGRNPQKACYALGDRQAESQLAPLALIELLSADDQPQRVVALCTPEARTESFPLLEAGLQGRCAVSPIDVPAGHAQEDLNAYLSRAAAAIPADPGVELTVDVTHGYRHFSYLTYLVVLYLVALRGVRLRGAYYGLLRTGAPSAFLDLRPLLALPRWFHALEVLRETGSALPIAAALGEGRTESSTQGIIRDLSLISESYLSGLPLELGHHARRFCQQRLKPLRKLLEAEHHLPLAPEMVRRVTEIVEPFSLTVDSMGDGWKRNQALSEPELRRQARIIQDLFGRGSVATALGLLNEWTVSWASWCLGQSSRWLDFHGSRRSAGSVLGAIAAVSIDSDLQHFLSDEQRRLGEFWRDVCELRNAYHHHGMRPQVLVGNRQVERKLKGLREYWENVLCLCPVVPLKLGAQPGGRVLVSPLGMRSGVLFSAIHAATAAGQSPPATCIVICSPETEPLISEAAEKACFTGIIEPLRADPFGGREEITRLVKASGPFLLAADEVLVNATGGTTLMGLAAEAIGDAARKLARPVRRFGLIDRRPPDRQEADPFQLGEAFWLDADEGGSDADD